MNEHYRKEFEEHLKQEENAKCATGVLKPCYNTLLGRYYDGTYFMSTTQERWVTWNAAINLINQLGESK